jgi:hypothetical protein
MPFVITIGTPFLPVIPLYTIQRFVLLPDLRTFIPSILSFQDIGYLTSLVLQSPLLLYLFHIRYQCPEILFSKLTLICLSLFHFSYVLVKNITQSFTGDALSEPCVCHNIVMVLTRFSLQDAHSASNPHALSRLGTSRDDNQPPPPPSTICYGIIYLFI